MVAAQSSDIYPNVVEASQNGRQLRAIIKTIITQNSIVGSDNVRVFSATTDNEPATALGADLLTNGVGSVRCVVHTVINDVVFEVHSWNKYMAHVENVTSFFNQYPKSSQLLLKMQCNDG